MPRHMKKLQHGKWDKGQKQYGFNKQKILRRGSKNTQKNYTKKDPNDTDNHNSVITHLEPDIWNVKSSRPQEASL